MGTIIENKGIFYLSILLLLVIQIFACESKENSSPSASFIFNPSSGDAPLAVSFDASGSRDPDGSIRTYQWNFGDSATGSGVTVSHTFTSAGSYIVTLSVTDDKNSTASTTGTVNVSASISSRISSHSYPKLANQIQDYNPSAEFLQNAAYYDLLVLDAEVTKNGPSNLGPFGALRNTNPNVVIVLYFSAADIIPWNNATINAGFISGLQNDWYMKDTFGNKVKLFELTPGNWTEMLNLSTDVNSYMANYLSVSVMAGGLADGIFYDWISDEINWLNNRTNSPNGPLDINNDSVKESDGQLNSIWQQGTITLLQNSRAQFPSNSIIMGNGGWRCSDVYDSHLNGMMIEDFLGGESMGTDYGWCGLMLTYYQHTKGVSPNLSFIMANGDDSSSFQFQRFALASALMFDGYFCFTNKGTYESNWWFDEYSVNLATGESVKSFNAKGYLGKPLGEAHNTISPNETLKDTLLAGGTSALNKVWERFFENGMVLVNPSSSEKTVEIGATFKKIKGILDPSFNTGESVTQVILPPRSGIILLR